MPIGVRARQVVALAREVREIRAHAGHVSVAGPGAEEVAAALTAGGDVAAVRVGGDAARAAVAVRIVEGEIAAAELAELRRLTRLSTPIVVLRRGRTRVPYVLPADVLDVDDRLPLDALAAAIARAAPDLSPSLAARLPVLRPAVERRLIRETSWRNALIAFSAAAEGGHPSPLGLAQSRMLLLMDVSRGAPAPDDPETVARWLVPPVAASAAAGLVARSLVRRLSVPGRLGRAGIAYGVTRGLGSARVRLS